MLCRTAPYPGPYHFPASLTNTRSRYTRYKWERRAARHPAMLGTTLPDPAMFGTMLHGPQSAELPLPLLETRRHMLLGMFPLTAPETYTRDQPFTRQAKVGSPEQTPLCAAVPCIPCAGFSRLASWAGCLLRWPAAAFPLEGPSSRISSLGPQDHMFLSSQRTSAAGPVTTLPGAELK